MVAVQDSTRSGVQFFHFSLFLEVVASHKLFQHKVFLLTTVFLLDLQWYALF